MASNVKLNSATSVNAVQAVEGVRKLPQDLLLHAKSFLPELSTHATLHKVCRQWRSLPFGSKHLDLSQINQLTDERLEIILREVTKTGQIINSINLSGSDITNRGLALLSELPITTLNLSNCRYITDQGLSFLTNLPLTSLNLSRCLLVTGVGLSHLATAPLVFLSLAACLNITDISLKYVKKLSTLSSLDVSWCSITDEGLSDLKELSLTSLNLYECDRITNAGLAHLTAMPLISLNLENCSKITRKQLSPEGEGFLTPNSKER